MGEPATDDLALVEGSVREPMTWVWSPPRVEKRVDSSPYPQLAPELGFGSGGDRGGHYGGRGALEAKTIHTLQRSQGGG
jgi:hypothetical protein